MPRNYFNIGSVLLQYPGGNVWEIWNIFIFIELSWFYRRRIQILFGSIIPHRLCKYPAYATGCSCIRSEKEWNGRVAPRPPCTSRPVRCTSREGIRVQKPAAEDSDSNCPYDSQQVLAECALCYCAPLQRQVGSASGQRGPRVISSQGGSGPGAGASIGVTPPVRRVRGRCGPSSLPAPLLLAYPANHIDGQRSCGTDVSAEQDHCSLLPSHP